jgi:hypothetical protein
MAPLTLAAEQKIIAAAQAEALRYFGSFGRQRCLFQVKA